MPSESSTDIYLKFLKDGQPIDGECQTVLAEPSPGQEDLSVGFKPTKMFQLDSFSFSMDLDGAENADKDAAKNAEAARAKAAGTPARGEGFRKAVAAGATVPAAQQMQAMLEAYDKHRSQKEKDATDATKRDFAGWRDGKDTKYPTRISPMTFTRGQDKGTILLLRHCIDRTLFDRVSLVKRKGAGGTAAGQIYLRMDFLDCLLTQVSWSNGDPVKENVQFISRTIVISYKPQLPSGDLGGVVKRWWSVDPRQTEPDYGPP